MKESKIFQRSTTQLTQFFCIVVLGISATDSYAEDHLKIVLKNAFIERNYDEEQMKDPGSWSQGISGFYTSDYVPTSLAFNQKPLEIGMDASLQYALRLSDDRHVNDTVRLLTTKSRSKIEISSNMVEHSNSNTTPPN